MRREVDIGEKKYMCVVHVTFYYDSRKRTKKTSCIYMYIVHITCMQMSVKSLSIYMYI